MTIEERLEALERGLSAAKRRNKYLLIGLVVLAIGWAFTSTTGTVQAQGGENIVRAEKFELVDSQGNVRAALAVTDSGPTLEFYDENGKTRAALNVFDSGPMLRLYDESETFRAVLAVSYDVPWLCLLDANGRPIWSAP